MRLSIYISTLAALSLMTACSQKKATTEKTTTDEKPQVQVSQVHAKSVDQVSQYTATVEGFNVNNITTSTPNRIKDIRVDIGDRVSKGQPLVILDDVNIEQLKIRLDNTKRDLDRAKYLLEIGGGTQQSVDQLTTEYEASLRQYRNMVENTTLISPINGVVTARNYDPGDMTGSLPILTVEQLDPVKIMLGINESEYSRVNAGMPVEIRFDALPDQVYTGNISVVYPTVDPKTRTFTCQIDIDNDGKVRPGMFSRVTINYGQQNNVVVPDRAVVKMSGSGNKYVYVLGDDGKVSYNQVQLGQRLGDTYEVLSGVEDGDIVVINGQSRLADGVEVEVIDTESAE